MEQTLSDFVKAAQDSGICASPNPDLIGVTVNSIRFESSIAVLTGSKDEKLVKVYLGLIQSNPNALRQVVFFSQESRGVTIIEG